MSRPSRLGVGLLAILLCVSGLRAQQPLTKQDSESLQRKLAAIESRGAQPPTNGAKQLRTSLSEREVNAYFKYDGRASVPTGVADPEITISDNGQLEAK